MAGVEVKCFVLDDGERVIEAESFHRFLAAVEGGSVVTLDEMKPFVRWQCDEETH